MPANIDPARQTAKKKLTPAQAAAAAKRGQPGRGKGTGDTGPITVKGAPATSAQRTVINQALTQAEADGASRRVMIAAVMAMTQESGCTRARRGDAAGPDSRGPYQQRAAWGPLADRMDPAKSTHMFLTGGQGGQRGWKQAHGSLKNAPGNLSAAINEVQGSQYPNAYAAWHDEAVRTVDQWRGGADGLGTERIIGVPYLFERGSKDRTTVESSWDAMGRIADERGWHRWAALNTLFYVSDRELRAAAPSLEIHGDEPWLLTRLSDGWEWGSAGRRVSQITFRVLSERWGVLPGAVVLIAGNGALDGRYLVSSVRDHLRTPESEITIRRPVPPKKEPAHDTTTQTDTGAGDDLLAACRDIDGKDLPYVWGGGHAHAATPDRGTGRDPGIGYDCSGAVGAALALAGLLIKPGDPVPASGVMAKSLGEPGKGREFTIWASDTHVWIELHNAGEYKRFDTSPHGDGPRGAHLRKTARTDQARFTARHAPNH